MSKNLNKEQYLVDVEKYKKMIGKFVRKKSGKSFKSGLKQNLVKGVTRSDYNVHDVAYYFFEDDSFVECRSCEIAQKIFYFL